MLGHLHEPPIVETVCGFQFEGLEGLDPILIGKYWTSRSSSYPKRDVRPAIRRTEGISVFSNVGPIRCWLISDNDEFVVQIQPDGFYFNWRRCAPQTYPRFRGKTGIRDRALEEFAAFASFCKIELDADVVPNRIELTKVDVLPFESIEGLSKDIPLVAGLLPSLRSDLPDFLIEFAEQLDGIDLRTRLSARLEAEVRVETFASITVRNWNTDLAFLDLNEAVNTTFEKLLSHETLKRFRGTP